MARFDVYNNPDGPGYLLDLQTDLLEILNTRVVVPLLPAETAPTPAKRLNPVFQVEDQAVIMVTQFIATVPSSILRKPLGTLDAHHSEIINAIDMVFLGF